MMQYMVYAVQTSGCDKSTMANAGIGFSRLGLFAKIRKSQEPRHSSNAASASVDDADGSVALGKAKARPLTACATDGCMFVVNSDVQWGRGAYCCGLCADSGGAKHGKHCERDPASTGTDRAKPDTATAKKKKTKKWKKASAASKDAAHATETATEAAPAQKTKWQQTHEKKAPTAGEPDWLADAGSDESDWGDEHKASRPKEAAAASDDPPWGEHKASGSKASLTSSIHPGTYEVAQGFWANAAPSTPSTPAPPVPEDDGDGEPGRRPWRWRRKKIFEASQSTSTTTTTRITTKSLLAASETWWCTAVASGDEKEATTTTTDAAITTCACGSSRRRSSSTCSRGRCSCCKIGED